MKSLLAGLLFFASTSAFASTTLVCKIVMPQTQSKVWSYFKEFHLQVDQAGLSGHYIDMYDESHELVSDQDTTVTYTVTPEIIALNINTWSGYDNFVGDLLIKGHTGTLKLYESIDCLGETETTYEVACE